MSNNSIKTNLSSSDYHADPAIGSTSLKRIEVPAAYKWHQDNPQELKDCFRIGTLIHSAILEPEKIKTDYLIAPSFGKRTKVDREEWALWFSDNGANGKTVIKLPATKWYQEFQKQSGKTIVTPDELSEFLAMVGSVRNNLEAMKLLTGGRSEMSMFWKDVETGLKLKCRPDYLNDHFCSDVKSTKSGKQFAFSRSMLSFGYHISQAMYQDGIKQCTGRDVGFRYIVIEKEPPFLCAVYQLSDESAELGRTKYHELLRKLADCLESDSWPGLENNFDLSLPTWALDDGEDQVTFGGLSL